MFFVLVFLNKIFYKYVASIKDFIDKVDFFNSLKTDGLKLNEDDQKLSL